MERRLGDVRAWDRARTFGEEGDTEAEPPKTYANESDHFRGFNQPQL